MNLFFLSRLLSFLRDYLKKPDPSARGTLYVAALSCLGTDASPNDIAPDEFGCAESVNAVHRRAFGWEIGGTTSTYRMYQALLSSPKFIVVDHPMPGDIVISPTGYGNGKLPNGHVGIVGTSGIFSSDSKTGLFLENYTLDSWRKRYVGEGGYPMKFFQRI